MLTITLPPLTTPTTTTTLSTKTKPTTMSTPTSSTTPQRTTTTPTISSVTITPTTITTPTTTTLMITHENYAVVASNCLVFVNWPNHCELFRAPNVGLIGLLPGGSTKHCIDYSGLWFLTIYMIWSGKGLRLSWSSSWSIDTVFPSIHPSVPRF